MIHIIYGISFAISVVMLIVMLEKRKIYDVYHLMLTATIALCNTGYMLLSVSKDLREALLANKISYLGCFLPFFMFMVISKLCRINVPRWVSFIMVTYAAAIYGCVLTIGHSTIYYKTVSLVFQNGGSVLLRTYGFAHTLYNIMILGYMGITFAVVILSFRRKNIVSHVTVFSLCLLMALTCGVFVVQKLLPVKIELMPIAYAVNSIVLVYWLWKSDMYDVSIGVIRAREKDNSTGYLIFNSKKQYCAADNKVKSIFPEINELYIDKAIPASDSFFYNTVVTWFCENADKGGEPTKTVTIGERSYKMSLLLIQLGRRNKLNGYLIEFDDVTSEQNYIKMIDSYNETLEHDIAEKTENIRSIQTKIIIGIAAIVESRDNSTGGHIRRTSDVVSIFAEELQKSGRYDKDFLQSVIKAAPMHDIGKVSVDDRILRKQGKYTPDEYAEMQKHSSAGALIVRQIFEGIETPEFVEIVTNIAHYHHEKWNGLGYPCGLRECDIPVEARIMALADVFDALVSKRCYKESYPYYEAFKIIEDSLGTHFDPDLGTLFIGCRDRLISYYDVKSQAVC